MYDVRWHVLVRIHVHVASLDHVGHTLIIKSLREHVPISLLLDLPSF